MKTLLTQKQNLNTRWIHLLGGAEAMGENTDLAQQRSAAVETPEAFIARHNEALTARIQAIPVSPVIRELCHDNITTLVCEAADPAFAANQNRIANAIEAEVNSAEGAEFTAAEVNPDIQYRQEDVETERAEREAALQNYLQQVAEAQREQAQIARDEAGEEPEKLAHARDLEIRGNLMQAAGETLAANGIDWTNEIPFGGGNDALVAEAKGHVGIKEGSAEADRLAGLDTDNIAWCGGGAAGLCRKAGIQIPEGHNLNVAENWVSESGATGEHVAIYVGGGRMIGCNQSNAITETEIPGSYRFNTPTNIEQGLFTDCSGQQDIQPGDIIVTSRGAGNSDTTGASPQAQTS